MKNRFDNLQRLSTKLRNITRNWTGQVRLRRALTMFLALAVVMSMTSALTLPAITLTQSAAQKQGGIELQAAKETQEASTLTTSGADVEESDEIISGENGAESSASDKENSGSSKGNSASADSSDKKSDSGKASSANSKQKDQDDSNSGSGTGSSDNNSGSAGNADADTNNAGDADTETYGSDENGAGTESGEAMNGQEGQNAEDAQDDQEGLDDQEDLELITAQTELKYEGEGYTITAIVDEDAKLPENTQLQVRELVQKLDSETEKQIANGEEPAQITSADDFRYKDYYEQAEETVKADAQRADAQRKDTDTDQNSEKDTTGKSGSKAESNTGGKSASDPQIRFVKFYDITLVADGEAFEPAAPIDVRIAYDRPIKVENTDDVRILHLGVDHKTGSIDPEIIDNRNVDLTAKKIKSGSSAGKYNMTEASFKADSFSVYGIVYTVDFQYEADGSTYELSIKGGDSISLGKLAEVLHIAENYVPADNAAADKDSAASNNTAGTASDKDSTANSRASGTASKDDNSGHASGSDTTDADNDNTAAGTIDKQITASSTDSETIAEDDLRISKKTKAFLEQIKTVEFSDPELLWIGKIEKKTTTGELMVQNDLVPVYPYGTTDQEFCEIYMREFASPDWAMISLKPFNTMESLTITMKNGDEITIQVTDDADAVLIDDGNGGKKVQTISNPSGTTIDLFDYWITDALKNSKGMDGWPGHTGDAFSSYNFDHYNYNGQRQSGGVPMSQDPDRNNDWYINNGSLRGNGNNQGINTNHVFKFYPGAAGTVVDYGDKGSRHRRGTNSAWTNNHDKYSSINSWTGSADPTSGLVQKTLNSEGYPQLTDTYSLGTDGSSLSYLFDGTNHAGKQKYGNVDNLLYVDSDGYYTYDSRYYSATYNDGDFTVRKFADNIATDSAQRGFWPFGDRVNWHGMHMTTNFSMPANGQVLNPKGEYKDMEFQFSGDDDTWLYLDGILVGDGGGIHNRTEIDINFATGLVTVKGTADPNHPGSYVWTRYLDEIYRDAGKYNDYQWEGHTFKSNTYHKFEMFYLERGGSESNLYIHYNLVSTTDFSAHKSYHSEDNARLMRDQFQFELIGFDNTEYYNGFVPAIMPASGSENGAGTVADPKKTHSDSAPAGIELPAGLNAHTSLITGVTEDGNVNFGNIQIQASQAGKEYKYIVREVVPGDAANADGILWSEASDEVKAEGGFIKDNITYDGKVYYFIGKVEEILAEDGTGTGNYELKKYRYTDASYETPDTETKFFSFVNGYVRPITLKVLKKSESGKSLSGAEFSLTRAMKNEDDKWVVRQYQHGGQTVASTPRTGTTSNGLLTFDNLPEGHYILEETAAPSGYTRGETYRWLLTLTKQDAADKIVLVPTIQAMDEDGSLTGNAAELTPDANNVIQHEVINGKIPKGGITVEKKWLKADGASEYTDSELETLDINIDSVKITGELWRKGQTTTTVQDPTVTIYAKLDNQSNYQQKWQGQIANGSGISYSMAVNGTGYPKSQTTSTGAQPVQAADQNITYDNGINKPSGHVYTLKNVTEDVEIYAEFDHSKANNTGIGFKLVSKVDPTAASSSTTEMTDEKFADFTLQKGSWSKTWTATELYGADTDEDWTYYFKNVHETPELADFAFTEEPEVNVAGTTTTYTYKNIDQNVSVKILKVIEDTETPLAGAEFTLTQVDSDKHVVTDEHDDPITQTGISAETTGALTFEHLTPGAWYMLEETGVPAGYIKEEGPYYIHISEDGSGALDTTVAHTMISQNDAADNEFTVENKPGAALPNSGSTGTTWLYIVGSLLLLISGGTLIIRRRIQA